jgi:hypothetical protein
MRQPRRSSSLRRAGNQLRIHEHEIKRVLQLVRHDGQKLATHGVGCFEQLAHLHFSGQQRVALFFQQLRFGDVTRNLGVSAGTCDLDRGDRPTAKELGSILAHMPAFIEYPARAAQRPYC